MSIIKDNKTTYLFLFLSFTIAFFVFFKNAWVSEDAYILFRSIEQLFAGNGPVWNPHERVQVFTSPLWFWVLSFFRMFSSDIYLIVTIVSFILWISTLLVLKKLFNNYTILLMVVLLFTASTGFFDYTSSGLENPLAYFLISIYVLYYIKLFSSMDEKNTKFKKEKQVIKMILFLFGLIICVRHDLMLIILPSLLYVLWQKQNLYKKKKWFLVFFVSFLPFILWTLFSLIYYGFPFPNTAYAKLYTGIDKIDLISQGFKYFLASFKFDIISLIIIFSALFFTFKNKSEKKYFNYLAYGIVLNLAYIVYVGGDFMLGRFLSYAYLISLILLVLKNQKIFFLKSKFGFYLCLLIILYLFVYPHTPFNSPIDYDNKEIYLDVADERGFYFNNVSLYQYLLNKGKEPYFPLIELSKEGYNFRKEMDRITIRYRIGFFGYWAGTKKIIVDLLALSDPLLARMPAWKDKWRIGHFSRKEPKGYLESIYKDKELIKIENINKYYKKIKIITQSKILFTKERIKTIILMNLGWYDYLLDGL